MLEDGVTAMRAGLPFFRLGLYLGLTAMFAIPQVQAASKVIAVDVDGIWMDLPGEALSGALKKGVRHHLPQRPGGCFAQMVPDPFFWGRPDVHDGDRINRSAERWSRP